MATRSITPAPADPTPTAAELEVEILDVDVEGVSRALEVARGEPQRWLLPAGELYVAAQAAPNTERTYRSALRSFALFLQRELGLAPCIDALMLSTVVDYKRYLQGEDPATGQAARPELDDRQAALGAARLRAVALPRRRARRRHRPADPADQGQPGRPTSAPRTDARRAASSPCPTAAPPAASATSRC
jgi:hypothetical protein